VATLRYEHVDKTFPGGAVALDDVSLEIEDGEFMVFLGPSGSGKSTLLRVMAGLEPTTGGRLFIDDDEVTHTEPQERDLAMVFQAYALYPHKTVRHNLEFGLRMRGMSEGDRRDRVERIARTLDIGSLLDRKPGQLSGGQRQRVALGRALVREPRAFLLDEPLSNLDPALRLNARTELARLHRNLGGTFLYVTHDQEEAMTLGDRVAVLRAGRVQQVAPPMELFRRPATRFVAEFIGSPSMNTYRCRVDHGEPTQLRATGFALDLTDPESSVLGEEVFVGIRPHDVVCLDEAGDPRADATGRVDLVEPRGTDLLIRLHLSSGHDEAGAGAARGETALILPPDAAVHEGEIRAVRFPRDRLHYFDVEDERRIEVHAV
jgi:ABC-type sugar transport system ATPase subunit